MIRIEPKEKAVSELAVIAPIAEATAGLPALVDRAAQTLASARTAAEVLDARDMASVAYDTAKRARRLADAKGAFNEIKAKIARAQAEALEVEAAANRRLADEYDAAQERGEVVGPKGGGDTTVPVRNAATASDLGLSRKQIHEARIIRDAEKAEPGIVHKTVTEAIEKGEEPTRAKVRRAALQAARPSAAIAPPARGKAAIIARVREAITALSGLPPAAEVAGYLRGTNDAIIVGERLEEAAEWLAAFADAWEGEMDHVEAAE